MGYHGVMAINLASWGVSGFVTRVMRVVYEKALHCKVQGLMAKSLFLDRVII